MLLVQPILTVVWGRLLFQETLSTVQIGGVLLVLLGVLALNLRGSVRRPPAADPGG
jgi:drug/metabolite transporter (DMT)-like permease